MASEKGQQDAVSQKNVGKANINDVVSQRNDAEPKTNEVVSRNVLASSKWWRSVAMLTVLLIAIFYFARFRCLEQMLQM